MSAKQEMILEQIENIEEELKTASSERVDELTVILKSLKKNLIAVNEALNENKLILKG